MYLTSDFRPTLRAMSLVQGHSTMNVDMEFLYSRLRPPAEKP